MKSFKLYNGKRDKFSLRKKNVGLVSIAIASLAIYGLAIGAPTVQADENSSVNAVSTENVTAPASTDTTAAAGLASEVSTPSTSVSTTEVPVSEGTSAGAENNSSPAPATVSENAASASGATAVEKVETLAQTTGQPDEKVSVPTTSSVAESTNKVSADTSTSAAVAKENSASAEPKPIEQSTNAQSYSAFRSAGAVRTRRSVKEASSHISDFSVTVTTKGGTVMNPGDTEPLPAQEVSLDKVQMDFKIIQDGTLKKGDVLRIPVKLENNAYGAYYANLGSGTAERIEGVGTIKFVHSDPNNLAYEITLDQSFQDMPRNTEKTVSITQKAATIGKFTAKSSYENIILEINGNKFTFKPTPRTFEKAQANFAVYNSASSDRANSIKIGTSTGDANYYNNLLSSDGTNSGQTGIPNGDIISVHRIKPSNGSKIVSIKPDLKRYTSTLAISEDGKYLVKGDTSTSISINSDPDNKLVELPANSTDEEIVKALKQAGKNSSVVIDNGDGTYTVAINLGKMTGNGATTYHDIWPTDDYAQMGDKYQEINRTEEVNRKVSSILKNANVIQGTGHSTRITFADSSIENALDEESKSFSYNVDDNGTIKKIREEKLSAKTTPSIARAVGQKKITIHYVDTNGKELETRDFKYGYPAGAMAPQTPDYQAAPKTIVGYTLVKADTVINAYGSQLKEAKSIPFINEDQNFYYVYSPKPSYAKVKYIDDDTNGGKVLETKDLNGFYGQTDPYRTAETIKTYTDRNYELVSDNYPTNGVTYNETLQTFEVHLRHKGAAVLETKTVTETIKYVYEDNTQAADTKVQTLKFYRINTKDLVTNKIVYKGPWILSTGTFPEVVSPKIDGYTPDKATVAAVEQITGDSADIEETVTYKADKQKVTYTIIDDTAQKTLKDKEVLTSGGSDTPLPDSAREKYDLMVNAYLAQGYELVSKEQLPAKFDLDSSHDQNVVVHLKHGTTDIQESKSVNLTVRYHGAGGQTPADKVQTATWTRTVTKDKITGTEVSATAWKADKANYDAVPSPMIPGYSVDVETVPSEAVTQENIVKDVYYTIQTQKVTYTVVDETTGQTLENQVELTTGESDAALPAAAKTKYDTVVAGYLAQGYEVASKDELPAQFDTDSSVDQNVVIRLKHKVSTSTETKTVTQTINYVYEDDNTPAAPEKKASLTFTREVKTDEVTKDVTPGAWAPSTGTFPEVVSPTVDGYTPDKAKVDAEHVTADQTDIKVTVKYKADKQKVTYTIIDDTTHTTLKNKVELTTGDSGANLPDDAQTKYDKAVDDYLAKGYELVSKDNLPTQFDTDSSVDQNVVVHLKHKVTASTENTTVTETIHYVYKDGSQAAESHKATLDFAREVRTDEVTKAVTKGAWSPSTSTFVAVTSPIIAGYTADKPVVEAVDGIIGDSKDVVVKVTYTADKQKVTYTVIDETTQKTLENQVELTTGDSDSALPTTAKTKYEQIVKGYTDKGYELISKDDLPAKFDKDSTKDQNVVIRLKHSTTDNKESKKVSLTVRYHGAGSQTPANNVQTATWTRIVTKDKVTGDVVKTTDWTADKANYNAVPSPVISGYTVDVATVPQEKVTQEDIVKDVHYGIQTQKVTYTVIDDTTGTTLENQVELTTGHSGTNLPTDAQTKYDRIVKGYTDKGYELVSKDDLPAQFDKDSSVDQNVVVHLKHKVTTSSEIKTVKETIHYVYQNGSEARSSYGTSLSFTREVKTDEVTKLSTKGSWSPVTGTFAAVTSPMITGYTADKPIVAAVDGITGDSEDIVETVVYKANQERAQVRYIDDTTGATLETKELTGDYNTTDSYRTADTISHYTSQGYELVSDNYPSTGVIYNETYQKFEVHLKHGTAESQESKKVSLTVRYHGAGSQTPADNVQTVTWTRTVTKDKVTGDVVKTTDWVADKATYDAVPSPVIPGYTVDVATVSAETVTQEDMVKDVYYTAIPVTPDKPTPPVVPSTPDKPTTPTVVPTTPTKATPTKTEILPSTGDSQVGPTLATLTGVSLLLSAFGYIGRRKKED
ncbi:MAG TPA: cell wall protein [Streptococcus sp.]|nr:cell wall protein [Streptococcus sp.]